MEKIYGDVGRISRVIGMPRTRNTEKGIPIAMDAAYLFVWTLVLFFSRANLFGNL